MSQIRSLQVLRALAALCVAYGHTQYDAFKMASAVSDRYQPVILDLSGAGVDLFFIISGFVMVYASRKLFETAGGGQLFLMRRIARVVPLYWMMTSIFLFTLLFSPHILSSTAPTVSEILKSYFFIPYIDAAGEFRPVYKLGWTLNYEMFFYLVFSLLLFLPLRGAVRAITVLFAAFAALGIFVVPANSVFAAWFDPIILEFVMGALIAYAYISGVRLSPGRGWALIALGFCGFAIDGIFAIDAHGPVRPLVFGLPAALIVMGSVFGERLRVVPERVMAGMVILGDASYALYLLHPMVIRTLRVTWDHFGLSWIFSPFVFIALVLPVAIAAAIVAHFTIERPMTKYVQDRLTARRAAPAGAPV